MQQELSEMIQSGAALKSELLGMLQTVHSFIIMLHFYIAATTSLRHRRWRGGNDVFLAPKLRYGRVAELFATEVE
jgi:hypothetical protein